MKRLNLLLISFLFYLSAYAQVEKAYLNANDKFTNDPKAAINYILISKMSDTAYVVRKYTMQDTIIMQGTYKDSLLAIAHGRFTYYKKDLPPEKFKDLLYRMDQSNYVKQVGFFANGKKNGAWIEFEKKGVKLSRSEYKDDVLDGLFQMYSPFYNDLIEVEGAYVKGKKEGEWKSYGFDSLNTPDESVYYEHDKVVKQVQHVKESDLGQIGSYVYGNLKGQMARAGITSLTVRFKLNTSGKLSDVEVVDKVSPEIAAKIVSIYTNVPAFKPYTYDDVPVDRKISYRFSLDEGGAQYFAIWSKEKFGRLAADAKK